MIYNATSQFDFNAIHLAKPSPLYGGSFLSKINMTTSDHPLYMYTPACNTTHGIVTSGSKKYIDLQFTSINSNFIEWINDLEEKIQQNIFEHRNDWFVTDGLEMDDIQNAFIPIIKVKGGIYHMRVYLPKSSSEVTIFNENEMIMAEQNVTKQNKLIAILDFVGLKFNQKCFQIMVNVRQLMILENQIFSTCLIKPPEKGEIIEIEELKL
jgi:hypothetical protein